MAEEKYNNKAIISLLSSIKVANDKNTELLRTDLSNLNNNLTVELQKIQIAIGSTNSLVGELEVLLTNNNEKLDTINTSIGNSNNKLDILHTDNTASKTILNTLSTELDDIITKLNTIITHLATIASNTTPTNTNVIE